MEETKTDRKMNCIAMDSVRELVETCNKRQIRQEDIVSLNVYQDRLLLFYYQ